MVIGQGGEVLLEQRSKNAGDTIEPEDLLAGRRASLARPMARDWRELFIVDGAAPEPDEPAEESAGEAARVLPAAAREHVEDPDGAGRRGPGDAVREPRRGDVGAPRGGADHGRRRGEDDRGGRVEARDGGRVGRHRGRRGADPPAHRAARRPGQDRRRHDRPAARADRPAHGRRERDGQDDDARQARLAPQERLRARGAARRGRHVPRRGDRAARGVGAARADVPIVTGAEGSDPGAVAFDAVAEARRQRRRRRPHRHRRAPAQPGPPDGRADEDPPRDRQADGRTRRTRRCSPSTPPPARTACGRPSCSPRRSRSTGSS